MEFIIRKPETEEDFNKYYSLRYEVLRKPWNQPKGSERDELEENADHFMAVIGDTVIGVCRLHRIDNTVAQIRFMAVAPLYRGKGTGAALLYRAEEVARANGVLKIILQARESAVPFYKNLGYSIEEKTFIMYDSIQHFLMQKSLTR